jgi:hypothetical protein
MVVQQLRVTIKEAEAYGEPQLSLGRAMSMLVVKNAPGVLALKPKNLNPQVQVTCLRPASCPIGPSLDIAG